MSDILLYMSTQILIKFKDETIGAIQSYKVLKELYQDQYPMIEAGRVRFDRDKTKNTFSRDFVSKHSQIYPVDIVVVDVEDTVTLRNAWIEESGYVYTSKEYLILDKVVFVVEGIDV